MITSQATYFSSSTRRTNDTATIVFLVLAVVVFTAALYCAVTHPAAISDDIVTLAGL